MKKFTFPALLLLVPLMAACGTGGDTPADAIASIDDYAVSTTEATAEDGDFIYRLVSEREQYSSGGSVELYAELEYVGEQDSIDIYHAGSAFFFPMNEQTRGYQLDYPMEEPLLTTTLTKGEPLREQYSGSGGYSDQEEAAYIEFMQQVMNNEFPQGYYVVDGYADFYTETPDGVQTDYQIHAEIDFKVVDE